jgi:hypothetical protein
VQVSHGGNTVGLLVQRDKLFAGTLLTFAQAKNLASVLLNRPTAREVVGK